MAAISSGTEDHPSILGFSKRICREWLKQKEEQWEAMLEENRRAVAAESGSAAAAGAKKGAKGKGGSSSSRAAPTSTIGKADEVPEKENVEPAQEASTKPAGGKAAAKKQRGGRKAQNESRDDAEPQPAQKDPPVEEVKQPELEEPSVPLKRGRKPKVKAAGEVQEGEGQAAEAGEVVKESREQAPSRAAQRASKKRSAPQDEQLEQEQEAPKDEEKQEAQEEAARPAARGRGRPPKAPGQAAKRGKRQAAAKNQEPAPEAEEKAADEAEQVQEIESSEAASVPLASNGVQSAAPVTGAPGEQEKEEETSGKHQARAKATGAGRGRKNAASKKQPREAASATEVQDQEVIPDGGNGTDEPSRQAQAAGASVPVVEGGEQASEENVPAEEHKEEQVASRRSGRGWRASQMGSQPSHSGAVGTPTGAGTAHKGVEALHMAGPLPRGSDGEEFFTPATDLDAAIAELEEASGLVQDAPAAVTQAKSIRRGRRGSLPAPTDANSAESHAQQVASSEVPEVDAGSRAGRGRKKGTASTPADKIAASSQEEERQEVPSEAAEVATKTRAGRGRRKDSVDVPAAHIEQQETTAATEETVAQAELGRRAGRGGRRSIAAAAAAAAAPAGDPANVSSDQEAQQKDGDAVKNPSSAQEEAEKRPSRGGRWGSSVPASVEPAKGAPNAQAEEEPRERQEQEEPPKKAGRGRRRGSLATPAGQEEPARSDVVSQDAPQDADASASVVVPKDVASQSEEPRQVEVAPAAAAPSEEILSPAQAPQTARRTGRGRGPGAAVHQAEASAPEEASRSEAPMAEEHAPEPVPVPVFAVGQAPEVTQSVRRGGRGKRQEVPLFPAQPAETPAAGMRTRRGAAGVGESALKVAPPEPEVQLSVRRTARKRGTAQEAPASVLLAPAETPAGARTGRRGAPQLAAAAPVPAASGVEAQELAVQQSAVRRSVRRAARPEAGFSEQPAETPVFGRSGRRGLAAASAVPAALGAVGAALEQPEAAVVQSSVLRRSARPKALVQAPGETPATRFSARAGREEPLAHPQATPAYALENHPNIATRAGRGRGRGRGKAKAQEPQAEALAQVEAQSEAQAVAMTPNVAVERSTRRGVKRDSVVARLVMATPVGGVAGGLEASLAPWESGTVTRSGRGRGQAKRKAEAVEEAQTPCVQLDKGALHFQGALPKRGRVSNIAVSASTILNEARVEPAPTGAAQMDMGMPPPQFKAPRAKPRSKVTEAAVDVEAPNATGAAQPTVESKDGPIGTATAAGDEGKEAPVLPEPAVAQADGASGAAEAAVPAASAPEVCAEAHEEALSASVEPAAKGEAAAKGRKRAGRKKQAEGEEGSEAVSQAPAQEPVEESVSQSGEESTRRGRGRAARGKAAPAQVSHEEESEVATDGAQACAEDEKKAGEEQVTEGAAAAPARSKRGRQARKVQEDEGAGEVAVASGAQDVASDAPQGVSIEAEQADACKDAPAAALNASLAEPPQEAREGVAGPDLSEAVAPEVPATAPQGEGERGAGEEVGRIAGGSGKKDREQQVPEGPTPRRTRHQAAMEGSGIGEGQTAAANVTENSKKELRSASAGKTTAARVSADKEASVAGPADAPGEGAKEQGEGSREGSSDALGGNAAGGEAESRGRGKRRVGSVAAMTALFETTKEEPKPKAPVDEPRVRGRGSKLQGRVAALFQASAEKDAPVPWSQRKDSGSSSNAQRKDSGARSSAASQTRDPGLKSTLKGSGATFSQTPQEVTPTVDVESALAEQGTAQGATSARKSRHTRQAAAGPTEKVIPEGAVAETPGTRARSAIDSGKATAVSIGRSAAAADASSSDRGAEAAQSGRKRGKGGTHDDAAVTEAGTEAAEVAPESAAKPEKGANRAGTSAGHVSETPTGCKLRSAGASGPESAASDRAQAVGAEPSVSTRGASAAKLKMDSEQETPKSQRAGTESSVGAVESTGKLQAQARAASGRKSRTERAGGEDQNLEAGATADDAGEVQEPGQKEERGVSLGRAAESQEARRGAASAQAEVQEDGEEEEAEDMDVSEGEEEEFEDALEEDVKGDGSTDGEDEEEEGEEQEEEEEGEEEGEGEEEEEEEEEVQAVPPKPARKLGMMDELAMVLKRREEQREAAFRKEREAAEKKEGGEEGDAANTGAAAAKTPRSLRSQAREAAKSAIKETARETVDGEALDGAEKDKQRQAVRDATSSILKPCSSGSAQKHTPGQELREEETAPLTVSKARPPRGSTKQPRVDEKQAQEKQDSTLASSRAATRAASTQGAALSAAAQTEEPVHEQPVQKASAAKGSAPGSSTRTTRGSGTATVGPAPSSASAPAPGALDPAALAEVDSVVLGQITPPTETPLLANIPVDAAGLSSGRVAPSSATAPLGSIPTAATSTQQGKPGVHLASRTVTPATATPEFYSCSPGSTPAQSSMAKAVPTSSGSKRLTRSARKAAAAESVEKESGAKGSAVSGNETGDKGRSGAGKRSPLSQGAQAQPPKRPNPADTVLDDEDEEEEEDAHTIGAPPPAQQQQVSGFPALHSSTPPGAAAGPSSAPVLEARVTRSSKKSGGASGKEREAAKQGGAEGMASVASPLHEAALGAASTGIGTPQGLGSGCSSLVVGVSKDEAPKSSRQQASDTVLLSPLEAVLEKTALVPSQTPLASSASRLRALYTPAPPDSAAPKSALKSGLRSASKGALGADSASARPRFASHMTSFVPLVKQRQAPPPPPASGKQPVKVAAIEQAEAARRKEEQKAKERADRKLEMQRRRDEMENRDTEKDKEREGAGPGGAGAGPSASEDRDGASDIEGDTGRSGEEGAVGSVLKPGTAPGAGAGAVAGAGPQGGDGVLGRLNKAVLMRKQREEEQQRAAEDLQRKREEEWRRKEEERAAKRKEREEAERAEKEEKRRRVEDQARQKEEAAVQQRLRLEEKEKRRKAKEEEEKMKRKAAAEEQRLKRMEREEAIALKRKREEEEARAKFARFEGKENPGGRRNMLPPMGAKPKPGAGAVAGAGTGAGTGAGGAGAGTYMAATPQAIPCSTPGTWQLETGGERTGLRSTGLTWSARETPTGAPREASLGTACALRFSSVALEGSAERPSHGPRTGADWDSARGSLTRAGQSGMPQGHPGETRPSLGAAAGAAAGAEGRPTFTFQSMRPPTGDPKSRTGRAGGLSSSIELPSGFSSGIPLQGDILRSSLTLSGSRGSDASESGLPRPSGEQGPGAKGLPVVRPLLRPAGPARQDKAGMGRPGLGTGAGAGHVAGSHGGSLLRKVGPAGVGKSVLGLTSSSSSASQLSHDGNGSSLGMKPGVPSMSGKLGGAPAPSLVATKGGWLRAGPSKTAATSTAGAGAGAEGPSTGAGSSSDAGAGSLKAGTPASASRHAAMTPGSSLPRPPLGTKGGMTGPNIRANGGVAGSAAGKGWQKGAGSALGGAGRLNGTATSGTTPGAGPSGKAGTAKAAGAGAGAGAGARAGAGGSVPRGQTQLGNAGAAGAADPTDVFCSPPEAKLISANKAEDDPISPFVSSRADPRSGPPRRALTEVQSYDMTPYKGGNSEDDEEDEERIARRRTKVVPKWAREELSQNWARQRDLDPDEIFSSSRPQGDPLLQVFGKDFARGHRRGDSGDWSKDGLTEREQRDYRRAMGFTVS